MLGVDGERELAQANRTERIRGGQCRGPLRHGIGATCELHDLVAPVLGGAP